MKPWPNKWPRAPRRNAGVEVAISVTGIAGPGGGTVDKPVGTVWFGYAIFGRPTQAECKVFEGDRDAVRRQTVAHAVKTLVRKLES